MRLQPEKNREKDIGKPTPSTAQAGSLTRHKPYNIWMKKAFLTGKLYLFDSGTQRILQ